MSKKTATMAMAALIVMGLGACTSAGAPSPTERVNELQCTDNTVMVCTKMVGATRLQTAEKQETCSCH